MISIKTLLSTQDEQLKFVSDYIGYIRSFREALYSYENSKEKNDTQIKNTDLWIDSYIEMVPELQEFREFVLSEMSRLGIKPHDNHIYKNRNHYISGYKNELEAFRIALVADSIISNEEKPILIGTLNRCLGTNGYKKNVIGTPVFLLRDKYFIDLEPLNGCDSFRQFYYKETLIPFITINSKPNE